MKIAKSGLILKLGISIAITFAGLAQSREERPVSEKTPSSDSGAPVPLDLGEIVKGRLGDSDQTRTFQYWQVEFPAGDFKAILDVRRADLSSGYVGGTIQWFSTDGEKLPLACEVFQTGNENRWRQVCPFTIKKPLKAVLRYANKFTTSDYWMGVFKIDAIVQSPFFHSPPAVLPLPLNVPVTATVDGAQPLERDAWYLMKLQPGEYTIGVVYRRADQMKNVVGGRLTIFNMEGADGGIGAEKIDNDFSAKIVSKFKLTEGRDLLLRISATLAAFTFGKEVVTIKVESSKE